jgi:anti-sigma factor RsiW
MATEVAVNSQTSRNYGTVPFWENGHVKSLPVFHSFNLKNAALAFWFPARGRCLTQYERQPGRERAALDAWAAHVVAAAEGRSPSDNVVALGRAG